MWCSFDLSSWVYHNDAQSGKGSAFARPCPRRISRSNHILFFLLIKYAASGRLGQQREEAWATAEKCRSDFVKLGESGPALRLVLKVAKYCGFFSVWMTVFREFAEVKQALVEEFPGTARTCFDDAGNAFRRRNSPI